jgi:16S rRNA (cytosine1402-N4)-methyltransferase
MGDDAHRPHRPVLVQEVLVGLAVRPGGLYVDGTIGGGGHAREILEASAPSGRVLGIDWDPAALARARRNLVEFGNRVSLHEGNYKEMEEILARRGLGKAQGILLDLGASLEQLTSSEKGFSIQADGPLDMRYSPRSPVTAMEIVNHRAQGVLEELFRRYGEERWAGRIARAIVRSRPLATSGELARLVVAVVPGRRGRIHPATRVFQALRIEVNQELTNLERGIRGGVTCLERAGRLGVISYHSLEDGQVKRLFRELAATRDQGGLQILTPKPIRPGSAEMRQNRSARSARLRILERL